MRPDIVICHDVPERHQERAPIVVVEILSQSTAEKDQKAKRDLYEEQGVQCYIFVDPVAQSIGAYALNANRRYEPIHVGDRRTIPMGIMSRSRFQS